MSPRCTLIKARHHERQGDFDGATHLYARLTGDETYGAYAKDRIKNCETIIQEEESEADSPLHGSPDESRDDLLSPLAIDEPDGSADSRVA